MNMLYEGLKEKGALMLIPSSAVESMGMGGMLGAAAMRQATLTGGDESHRSQSSTDARHHSKERARHGYQFSRSSVRSTISLDPCASSARSLHRRLVSLARLTLTHVTAAYRRSHAGGYMPLSVWLSVRLAPRPSSSLVIVLTLALGIGANTAIFSVVNSLLLRTLPVPEPGRLVTISSDYALAHGFKSGVGWNYEMWTRLQQVPPLFDGMLLWSQPTFNLARGGETRSRARAARQRQLL